MTASILNISEADYRNDQIGAPGPSLNYTTAKTIVVESPLHAYHQHPRLGGQKWEPTPESEAGLVFHSLLLEGGKGLEILDFPDWRTNAAKAARDAARAAGKTPVLAEKLEESRAAVETIRARMLDLGLPPLTGKSELAVSWMERSKIGPVLCRAKLDHVIENVGVIMDIKTTGGGVSPEECARRIYDNGYDVQWASNTSWLVKHRPELAGRVTFFFVFCERNAPYAVTPIEFSPTAGSGQFMQMGRQRWARAVETWARCLRDKKWPGYVTRPVGAEPPHWAFAREQELTADAELSGDASTPTPPTPAKEVDPLDEIF